MHLTCQVTTQEGYTGTVWVTRTCTSIVLSDQCVWCNQKICKYGHGSLYLALFLDDYSGMIDHVAPKCTSLADLLPELHTCVKLPDHFLDVQWTSQFPLDSLIFLRKNLFYPQPSPFELVTFLFFQLLRPKTLDLSSATLSHPTSSPSGSHVGYTRINHFSTLPPSRSELPRFPVWVARVAPSPPRALKHCRLFLPSGLIAAVPTAWEHLNPDAWPAPSSPLCF